MYFFSFLWKIPYFILFRTLRTMKRICSIRIYKHTHVTSIHVSIKATVRSASVFAFSYYVTELTFCDELMTLRRALLMRLSMSILIQNIAILVAYAAFVAFYAIFDNRFLCGSHNLWLNGKIWHVNIQSHIQNVHQRNSESKPFEKLTLCIVI